MLKVFIGCAKRFKVHKFVVFPSYINMDELI